MRFTKSAAAVLAFLSTLCVDVVIADSVFNCDMLPREQGDDDVALELQPQGTFRILVFGGTEWVYGKPIYVQLQNSNRDEERHVNFTNFILQAHDLSDNPVGYWVVGPGQAVKNCDGEADTMFNSAPETRLMVEAMFMPPPPGSVPNGEIDFNAAVMANDGRYWTKIRSIIVTQMNATESQSDSDDGDDGNDVENEDDNSNQPSGPQSDEAGDDDNDFKKETSMKKTKEDELKEQLNQEIHMMEEESEKSKEKEQKREDLHQEMIEYEQKQRKQEKERLEMLEFEIRDKLEHEEEVRRQEELQKRIEEELLRQLEKDQPDTGAGSHLTLVIPLAVTSLFLHLL